MCCLFGLIDYGHNFTGKEKSAIVSVLATAAEARGTDATGIAYNHNGKLTVYKRPIAAHELNLRIPNGASVIMGHTRLTTQGNERKNRNNHPFLGNTGDMPFAFAHNGVLYNDKSLRKTLKLPKTKIETDSYIGVQLIEKKKSLDFDSLAYMAEKVEGAFTFTALDGQDNLYFVKGDNPLCIYHFPKYGLYIYASTEEILLAALTAMGADLSRTQKIKPDCGEILRIDQNGEQSSALFDDSHLWESMYVQQPYSLGKYYGYEQSSLYEETAWNDLKSVACYYGYAPEEIDALRNEGISYEEMEEYLYCHEEL